MPGPYTFDSFALLALFLGEPGESRVAELLSEAGRGDCDLTLTVVNLGEVIYSFRNKRDGVIAAESLAITLAWPVRLVDIDQRLALQAARIKSTHRMGYLDSFVVALAQQLDATVVTGDPDFRRVEGLVQVEWLPSA